ncbi:MAG: sigma-70 family RNA polymerase sigma factor [Chloroflexi bacterium]|nr:sigma-70 family RNA polymerase sigma factor [Chloroflexota bacterium]
MDWTEIYTRLAADRDDPVAIAALAERVRATARRKLGGLDAAAVEDAIAETCAHTVLGLASAHGAETFRGFVLGHLLNARQRALRWRPATVGSLEDADEPAVEDDAGPAPDELELLRECFGELPERERRAVALRFFADAAAERIAAELGVTIANARRIVFNGVAHLRRCAYRRWPLGRV